MRCNGPDPRIDRADVVRHVREQLAARAEPAAPPDLPLFQEPSSTIPMTGMRGRIAQRMHTSLQSMAQLTLTMDVDMGAVAAHRAAIDSSSKPRYTDYIVAAAAGALAQHPIVNSQIADGHLALLPEINVGLAVAVDGGLVVPVVQRADTMSLDDLSAETARLAEAARSGTLSLADLEGGTFSVTALGMFGVDVFTPVINPPNTAILGVGRLREGTRWDHNVPVKTTVLTLSLTWDHRAFDGAPAAEFVASIRDRLEAWGDRQGDHPAPLLVHRGRRPRPRRTDVAARRKGAALARMTALGLPVPPGFTLTTEACNRVTAEGWFRDLTRALAEGLDELEGTTGRRFGAGRESAPGQRTFGLAGLDARDDGHGAERRDDRRRRPHTRRSHRERLVRVGHGPPIRAVVRVDRAGHARRPASPDLIRLTGRRRGSHTRRQPTRIGHRPDATAAGR